MEILKFAENLREALATSGMTQQELADQVGTTQATVNRWLKGVNEPNFATLLEICFLLGETPNSLLGFDELTEEDFLAYFQDPETIEESRRNLIIQARIDAEDKRKNDP